MRSMLGRHSARFTGRLPAFSPTGCRAREGYKPAHPSRRPLERFVVIAPVDEEAVYFATADPAAGIPDVPDEDIWMWRWTSGESPQPVRLLAGRFHNDMSAGIWAVYERRGVS